LLHDTGKVFDEMLKPTPFQFSFFFVISNPCPVCRLSETNHLFNF
jgi:hypothetical protein